MADESIRKDFIDGVQEIFTTLFNDGVEDGIDLYLLSTQTKKNVYGENKVKIYQKPIKLTSQVRINPVQGEQDVETVKGDAQFVVPLKDLQDKGLDVSTKGLEVLRKGVIEYQGTYYTIDNIKPKAFIENVFLMYTFLCTEDLQISDLVIEEVEEPPVEGGDSGSEPIIENDG